MRVLMTEDEKFLDPESGKEIPASRILRRIRQGEDLVVESEETGEVITEEALVKILRSPGKLENILGEIGGTIGELGEELTAHVGSFEKWFDKMIEEGELTAEQAPEWYKKIDEEARGSFESLEKRVTALVNKALDRLGVPDREKIEELEERIEKLERSTNFPHDEI
ncbi:MAG: phasin family protein [bacterium]